MSRLKDYRKNIEVSFMINLSFNETEVFSSFTSTIRTLYSRRTAPLLDSVVPKAPSFFTKSWQTAAGRRVSKVGIDRFSLPNAECSPAYDDWNWTVECEDNALIVFEAIYW